MNKSGAETHYLLMHVHAPSLRRAIAPTPVTTSVARSLRGGVPIRRAAGVTIGASN